MHNQRLLTNSEFLTAIERVLARSVQSVIIISAFLKLEVLEHLSRYINKDVKVFIVSRWRVEDLLSGASDFEVYKYCAERGWDFRIDIKLHAKALLADENALLIGSANYTVQGTHLHGFGNNEISLLIHPNASELLKVYGFLDNSVKVDDDIWSLMSDFLLECSKLKSTESICWPVAILSPTTSVNSTIWFEQCLQSCPCEFYNPVFQSDQNIIHDVNVFGTSNPTIGQFKSLALIQWLDYCLRKECIDLSFGNVTALLHAALIPDIRYYRTEVKSIVKNLFDWIEHFQLFQIVQFRHRQSIKNPYIKKE